MRNIIAIFIALLTAIVSGQAAADQQLKPRHMADYTAYQCASAPDPDKPGGTRETAIERDPFTLASGAQTKDPDVDFDCKWVKLRGFYSWHQNYAFPFVGYLVNSARESALEEEAVTVENFIDPNERSSRFDRSIVEMTGFFFGLCAQHDQPAASEPVGGNGFATGGSTTIVISMPVGPCHYSSIFLLRDARVEKLIAPGPIYIQGEVNRAAFGSLVGIEEQDPSFAAIRQVFVQWITDLSLGRRIFYARHKRDVHTRNEDERALLNDPDTHLNFFLDPKRSPISKLVPDIASHQFRAYYAKNMYADADRFDPSETYRGAACFCLESECRDKWPLNYRDVWIATGPFLCAPVERERNATPEWSIPTF